MEEALRNGVTLAKLGNFFAADVVPLKRIYDKDLKYYKVFVDTYIILKAATKT